MWDLPGPGLEPVSSALAGGFLTIAPLGKPKLDILNSSIPSRVMEIVKRKRIGRMRRAEGENIPNVELTWFLALSRRFFLWAHMFLLQRITGTVWGNTHKLRPQN